MAEGVVFPFPSLPLNEGRTYGQPELKDGMHTDVAQSTLLCFCTI